MNRFKSSAMATAGLLLGVLWAVQARAEFTLVTHDEKTLGMPQFAPSDSVRSEVAVATERSKRQSVLVWADARPGDERWLTGGFVTGTPAIEWSLYAARFGSDGTALDLGGKLVARYRTNPTHVRVAGSWGGYTIVWSESGEIYGVYVGAATATNAPPVAWDTAVLLSSGEGAQHSPEIGCSSNGCIVAWVDERHGDAKIVAQRLSGVDLDGAAITLPLAPVGSVQLEPRVVFPLQGGDTYPEARPYVLWREAALAGGGLKAVRLNASDGALLDAVPLDLATAPMLEDSYSVAASREGGLLIAWQSPGGTGGVVGARFDDGGNRTTSFIQFADGSARHVRVAANRDRFYVLWEEPTSQGQRICSRALGESDQLGPVSVLAEGPQTSGIALTSALEPPNVIGWNEGSPPLMNAVFGRLAPNDDATIFVEPPRVVSRIATEQRGLGGIAAGAGTYLVTWSEYVGKELVAYAAKVTATGELAGEPKAIAHTGTPIGAGAHYLLVWVDRVSAANTYRSFVRALRLDGALESLDASPIEILEVPGYLEEPAAAFDGARTLIVASRTHAAFVDAAGAVQPLPGFDSGKAGSLRALSHGKDNFLLVWEADAISTSASFGYEVDATLLDASGMPMSGVFTVSSVLRNTRRRPTVAYGADRYLVVYQGDPSGLGWIVPTATRVSPEGVVEDSTGIAVAANTPSGSINQPALVFDGTNFVVAWSASYRGFFETQVNYVARVAPNGTALDPSGVQLAYPAQHQMLLYRAAIATLGSGWSMVGYAREDVELGWATRVKLRGLYDTSANGATCFIDVDCASHRCDQGRCAALDAALGQAGTTSLGIAGGAGTPTSGGAAATSFGGAAATNFGGAAATNFGGRSFAGTAGSHAGARDVAGTAGTYATPDAVGGYGAIPVPTGAAGVAGTRSRAWERRNPRATRDVAGAPLDGCDCRLGGEASTSRGSLQVLLLLLGTLAAARGRHRQPPWSRS